MFSLKAEQRDKDKKNNDNLREAGLLPAVLYGEDLPSVSLQVEGKQFEKVFKEAGESSLVELDLQGKVYQVLIHQIAHDPLTDSIIHVDFFHPSAKKKIEAEVPLIFQGMALAEKDLGGVLVKEMQEILVKGLARNLPREIKVDISSLKTFDDKILVKDLPLPSDVEVLRLANEIVAHVARPRTIEEEKPKEEEKPAEEAEETSEEAEEKAGKAGKNK